MTGARSWTGPALDRPLWPRSSEGQGQGQYICGPDMEGQGQVHKNSPGPGPDRTSDSLYRTAKHMMIVILIPIGQVLTPYGDASQFVVKTCHIIRTLKST